jgi:hypothetical protein
MQPTTTAPPPPAPEPTYVPSITGNGAQAASSGSDRKVNVDIDQICSLAAKFAEWSATIGFYLPGLRAALARATDAAGTQDPGQTFLHGDPSVVVCGRPSTGFTNLGLSLIDSITTLTTALQSVADDQLYIQAYAYHCVETANAEAFGAPAPPMPQGLAGKLASGWRPMPNTPILDVPTPARG